MLAVDTQENRTLSRKEAHHENAVYTRCMVSKRAFQSIQGRNAEVKEKLKARRDSLEAAVGVAAPSRLGESLTNASDESPIPKRAAPCVQEVLSHETSACCFMYCACTCRTLFQFLAVLVHLASPSWCIRCCDQGCEGAGRNGLRW